MNWTTPGDLTAQLFRRWDNGDLPRLLVTGASGFPLRLALKGPSSSDLTDCFMVVRDWATDLARTPRFRIVWREVRHRVQGAQRLPEQVWVDTLDDAVALLGKQREADCLIEVVETTRATLPALLPWLAKRPLQAIALASAWPRLVGVARWLQAHPRPGIYPRQVDIPGVHTKFIEAHRTVLTELFDLVLPPDAVDNARTGAAQFASRYGFLDKPTRIRFRVLDERQMLLPGCAHPDITLDAGSFANLGIPVGRVFITENETNFLAFPRIHDAIVIFGAGYGWDALACADWLAHCKLHYWGDIDTHGFAILDQLRSRLSHVSSFLMDRDTLAAHAAHWGEEPAPVRHDLPRLNAAERALFDDLRDDRIRENLRLEQERVGFRWLEEALARIGS